MRTLVHLALLLALLVIGQSKIVPLRSSTPEADPKSPLMFTYATSNLGSSLYANLEINRNSIPYKVMIALYTDQTFISGPGCSSLFSPYYCYGSSCSTTSTSFNYTYPYFVITGSKTYSSIDLDLYAYDNNYSDDEWYSYGPVAYATSCYGTPSSYKPTGVLGLGLANGNYYNFHGNSVFTIYLYNTSNTGILGWDIDYSKYTGSCDSFSSTTNWAMTVSGGSLIGYTLNFYGQAILDLNTNWIVFPSSLYNQVVSTLINTYGGSCYSYQSCYFYTSISNLPNIYLYIGGNTLTLPPTAYARVSGSYTYLNIAPSNYTTMYGNWSSYIILGTPFMKYYYSIFSISQFYPSIRFCKSYQPGDVGGWGALVFIVIILSICICIAAIAAVNKRRRIIIQRQVTTKVVTQPVIQPVVQPVVQPNYYVPPTQYNNQVQYVAPNYNNQNFVQPTNFNGPIYQQQQQPGPIYQDPYAQQQNINYAPQY